MLNLAFPSKLACFSFSLHLYDWNVVQIFRLWHRIESSLLVSMFCKNTWIDWYFYLCECWLLWPCCCLLYWRCLSQAQPFIFYYNYEMQQSIGGIMLIILLLDLCLRAKAVVWYSLVLIYLVVCIHSLNSFSIGILIVPQLGLDLLSLLLLSVGWRARLAESAPSLSLLLITTNKKSISKYRILTKFSSPPLRVLRRCADWRLLACCRTNANWCCNFLFDVMSCTADVYSDWQSHHQQSQEKSS